MDDGAVRMNEWSFSASGCIMAAFPGFEFMNDGSVCTEEYEKEIQY